MLRPSFPASGWRSIKPRMPHTIAVLSQKGGTGKTTAVRTLADAFRRRGVHTLVVDLDPQGNLSDYFGLIPDGGPTIADVLSGRAQAVEAIRGDLIPADLSLAEAELILASKMGRELTLRRTLADATRGYEVVLIDCPPSLGLLTVNALVAANRALITAEAQYFALRGVDQSIEVVELARECLNPELSLLGVLINMADMRTVHSRGALATLTRRFGEQVFGTVVRASIAYAESSKRSVSILDHRPDLGADYLALAEEVLGRLPGRVSLAPKQASPLGMGEHSRTFPPGQPEWLPVPGGSSKSGVTAIAIDQRADALGPACGDLDACREPSPALSG
jgi:chromosome partitioning protein